MEQGTEFTVEPFRSRKHDFRSDKGQRHVYPKVRQKWNPRICQRRSKTNLTKYEGSDQIETMPRRFKGTPSMRAYWRAQKRKHRAKKKGKK